MSALPLNSHRLEALVSGRLNRGPGADMVNDLMDELTAAHAASQAAHAPDELRDRLAATTGPHHEGLRTDLRAQILAALNR